MSYSRTMTGSVYWHTSGSVHYPASESGGSVGYSDSGTVPVTITVHVDTAPFDASVAGCNAEVIALGGAVAAMDAAQCEAIKNTSSTVSAHITGGFFSLIKSELSQNMAALFAKLNSGVMLIMEKTKLVTKQRDVMQGDYARASARYTKVFSDIDEECRRRVEELDKTAMRLSRDVLKKQISDKWMCSAASTVTYTNDGEAIDAKLFTAYIKSKVDIINQRISQHITQQSIYAKLMASLLRQDRAEAGDEVFIPMLYAKSLNMDDKKRQDENCYLCQTSLIDEKMLAMITDKVKEQMSSGAIRTDALMQSTDATQADGTVSGSVMKAFNALAEKYLSTDDGDSTKKRRVYETMKMLSRDEQEIKGMLRIPPNSGQ